MFSAVCVVLSAIGHVLASCETVPLWTLGVALSAVFAITAPLAGRERSLPGIAAGLAVGQLALHTLFGLGQQHAAAALPRQGSGDLSDGAVMALAEQLVCNEGSGRVTVAEAYRIIDAAGLDPAMPTAGHSGHAAVGAALSSALEALLPSPPMLLGHLLAALAIGLLMRHGETALFRLVRLSARGLAEAAPVRALRAALTLLRALRAGLPGAPARRPRTPRVLERDTAGPGTVALEHSVIRRGPPRVELAA